MTIYHIIPHYNAPLQCTAAYVTQWWFSLVTLHVGLLTVNRLTGPEGLTGPETDGPVNRRIIHYLAITAHVYKCQCLPARPPGSIWVGRSAIRAASRGSGQSLAGQGGRLW